MSKIFKRPMFRKGGKVEEGVMSLAAPRTNYEEGGITMEDAYAQNPGLKDLTQLYETVGGTQDPALARRDILSNLLIKGGLAAVSGAGAGKGTLGELATAFQQPTSEALTQMQALKSEGRGLRTAALGKFLETEQARLDRESKEKISLAGKAYESGSFAARVKEVQDILGKDALTKEGREQAIAIATKDITAKDMEGVVYQGILKMDTSGQQPDVGFLQTQPDGSIHLNPYTRQFYVKKSDPIRLELVDQSTLKEIQED